MPQKRNPDSADLWVVCLCGSAGALQAYRSILEALPPRTGMAIIVVAHRAETEPVLFPRLLARMTEMEVVQVTDGMRLVPNRVSVAPPHRQITIDGLGFRLEGDAKPKGSPVLISVFLKSLAQMSGARSIAVILSGMGHDGSSALQAIKAAGGIAFAQSDALYDSMPTEAYTTGFVDYMLPAFEIGKALAVPSTEIGLNLSSRWHKPTKIRPSR